MLNAHVFLIGMNGSGKSSLGQKLSQSLNMPFCDIEQRICALTGLGSAEEVRAKLGDMFYQSAETGLLMDLVGRPPHVVAATQSVCGDPLNVKIMRNHGVMIYIHKPLNLILKALGNRGDPSDAEYDAVIRTYHAENARCREAADAVLDNNKDFAAVQKHLADIAQNLLKD